VANLAVAVRKGIEPAPSLAHEAFEVAQWASQSSAAAAIQLVSTSSSPVVDRSRKAAFASREAAFPSIFDPSPVVDRSRKAAFASPFPSIFVPQSLSYIAEAILDRLRGQPLMAEEVQNLLGANEALVFFLVGANESYVFALTREGFEWRTISLGEENVSARVAAFRRGLDVDGLTKSVDARKPELFDLATAHEFYLALLGPVEALIKDKPRLLIVPTGPLTALPFHLLVTDKPATRERVCFAQKPARACVLCMIGAPWSVDLQPKRLDHRRPESNIGFEATPEFFGRRVGTGFEALIDPLLLVTRFPERPRYRLRSLLDDRLRRSRRSDRPDGRLIGQAGEAVLRHRRKLGRGDETLGASHGENPQLSGPVKFERLAG